jgi:hypothetical protein
MVPISAILACLAGLASECASLLSRAASGRPDVDKAGAGGFSFC